MIVCGIVAEYNPFHNGHLYQINKIKETLNPDLIIVIISGYFQMRGDISCMSKEDKALIATNYGCDLILELPLAFSLNSADIFAYKAVEILNNFKITHLCFGSESCNLDLLNNILKLEDDSNFKDSFKKNLKFGNSFANSYNFSLPKLESNDLLNIQYLKAIKKINNKIIPYPIKRINSKYNEKTPNNNFITSATAIRNLNEISDYVPKLINEYYIKNNFLNNEMFFNLLKHTINILSNDELKNIHLIKEGFENKIKKEINNAKNYDDLIIKLKSKRYTTTYIKRVLISILLNIKKDDINFNINNYNKVIAFNNNGQKYLNLIKKNVSYNKNLDEEICKIEKKAKLIYNSIRK